MIITHYFKYLYDQHEVVINVPKENKTLTLQIYKKLLMLVTSIQYTQCFFHLLEMGHRFIEWLN